MEAAQKKTTKKELTEKVIAHWERMIEWAKKQPSNNNASILEMEDSINESWRGAYCNYCIKYHSSQSENCTKCPIMLKYNKKCEDIGWAKAAFSKNWKQWIVNAGSFLEKLKQLRN
ncbi:hypothetical protein LCGC14_2602740 [marine sediment metagenome]|uniref:Uncharacterized protein n=1 Tax=marine sediment metagenome TaxID=412755 RepID=A0A0F9D112_9ZZZZ